MSFKQINIFWVIGLMLLSLTSFGQDSDFPEDEEEPKLFKKERKFKPENVRVGFFPEFSIGTDRFGQGILSTGLVTSLGYRIKDRFEPGVGFFYNYINYLKVDGLHNHTFGGFQDAKLYIWENLFAYERGLLASSGVIRQVVDPQTGKISYDQVDRLSYGNLFLGGGYDFPMGSRSEFSLMIMTNVFTNSAFPNREPIISMRFAFGFAGR